MKRFIDIYVPITSCNLNCHYCYVKHYDGRDSDSSHFQYDAKHISKALSRKRLGGTCLFNVCGAGETLIPQQLIEIVHDLLMEGHYVFIVTNGLLSNRFDEYMKFPDDLLNRLGFKFSFHYLELQRTGKMDVFLSNIKKVKNKGVSFSV